jgi:hypothetical protein
MPTIVAVIGCIVLVAISELSRIAMLRSGGDQRGRRIAAPVVGMLAAYLTMVALAFAFYRADGVLTAYYEVTVAEVKDGYPAMGKLENGDRIIMIDGSRLTKSLSSLVDERNGAPVRLTLVRGGQQRDVTIAPIGHDGHWIMGFRPGLDSGRTRDFGVVMDHALVYPFVQIDDITPHLFGSDEADPGGPKRIYEDLSSHKRSAAVLALMRLLRLAGYVLLLIAVVDLVRLVRAVTAR